TNALGDRVPPARLFRELPFANDRAAAKANELPNQTGIFLFLLIRRWSGLRFFALSATLLLILLLLLLILRLLNLLLFVTAPAPSSAATSSSPLSIICLRLLV